MWDVKIINSIDKVFDICSFISTMWDVKFKAAADFVGRQVVLSRLCGM